MKETLLSQKIAAALNRDRIRNAQQATAKTVKERRDKRKFEEREFPRRYIKKAPPISLHRSTESTVIW